MANTKWKCRTQEKFLSGRPTLRFEIDSRSFGERIFGYVSYGRQTVAILVVTEWHTLERGSGPNYVLLLIRPDDWTYSQFPKLTKGFAITRITLSILPVVPRHTDEIYQGGSFKVERETDLDTIDDWKPLPPAR